MALDEEIEQTLVTCTDNVSKVAVDLTRQVLTQLYDLVDCHGDVRVFPCPSIAENEFGCIVIEWDFFKFTVNFDGMCGVRFPTATKLDGLLFNAHVMKVMVLTVMEKWEEYAGQYY